ncbi:hypothetical protein DL96DRAFT_1575813 [Flagelloscypha sp. PMI_526]|nr:hypothetical protein DL96DRAFT_1575813 [Flagelloscypha sp. PMI_526]
METRYGQVGAEPFEEDWRSRNVSQEKVALSKFYQEQEQKERERKQQNLERKQSGKRRSNSLWRRKSNKDSTPNVNGSSTSQASPPAEPAPTHEREMAALEASTASSAPAPARSLVPEVIRDAPTWYTRDLAAPVSLNVRYNIHNPIGPRWYRNHHLLAPHEARPDARPSSYFSPDFPPMASSSSVRLDEPRVSSRRPPSVQSPASSQVRVAEKPRTRKTSQNTPDNVDFLDGSDPWGQNFHHTSPYDVSSPADAAPDPNVTSQTRSRVSSVATANQKHRTVTPSPLSQSTSAVHLTTQSTSAIHLTAQSTATINRTPLADTQSYDEARPSLPRKLSKRRTPVLGFFGGRSVSAGSAPVSSPDESSTSAAPSSRPSSKRESRLGPPPSNPAAFAAATKKDKRGSVLGRLAKKLSVYKKPKDDSGRTSRTSQILQMEDARPDDVRMQDDKLAAFVTDKTPSPRRSPSPQVAKRVPPPEAETTEPMSMPSPEKVDDDLDYSVSAAMSAYPQPTQPVAAQEPEPAPAPTPIPAPAPALTPLVVPSTPLADTALTHVNPPPSPTPPVIKRQSQLPPVASPAPQLAPTGIFQDKEQRISIASFEDFAFSIGKLTVANPDIPSVENTPNQPSASLPSTRESLPAATSLSTQLPSGARAPNPYHFQTNRVFKAPAPAREISNPPMTQTRTRRERSASPVKRSASPTKLQKRAPKSRTPSPERPKLPKVEVPRRQSKDKREKSSSRSPTKRSSAAAAASQHDLQPPPRIPAAGNLEASPAHSSTSMIPNYGSPIPTIPDLPSTPETVPPPLPDKEIPRPPPLIKRDSGLNRSTETFKLVRSASGTVYASGETIHAGGQSWEVVEEQDVGRRRSSRDRLADGSPTKRESRTRRERERQPSVEIAPPPKDLPSKRTSKRVSAPAPDMRDSYPGTSSSGSAGPAVPPKKSSKEKERGRGREREKEREKDRKSTRHSTQSSGAVLQRAPSLTNRPTSEMFPTAELNDLRAKEAWDLERLYKGRSMYGEEMRQQVASPPPPPVPAKDSGRQSHGSAHTSFMLQTPFAPQQQQQRRRSAAKSTSNRTSSDDVFNRTSANPLPPPPRESTFQPGSLRDSDPKTSEYWRQYAGVVAEAH